ncbi:MAG: hypothetical protein CL402_06105 [Acidiferrobacteraceae bacterium]|nr:hypothetical protein [Acidiferrobacteraceae bacterium]|tara:strand:+ start:2909 stop:3229 length:321 start_codon:yes stop_codon:yes gene_type:complete
MSQSIDHLKSALELEDVIREKLNHAMSKAVHDDTKEALRKMIDTKQENIDAIQWLIMAEANKLDIVSEKKEQTNGATQLAKGKCPFSAMELNKMGFNVTDEQLGRK